MIIYCSCCAKQVVSYDCSRYDRYVTIRKGAVASFRKDECICGYCAEELDENGNFPEEVAIDLDYIERMIFLRNSAIAEGMSLKTLDEINDELRDNR